MPIWASSIAEPAMNSTLISIGPSRARRRHILARAFALAAALAFSASLAAAQEAAPPKSDGGFIDTVSRWFSEQAGHVSSTFKGAGKEVEKFGDKAGDTVNGAKGAADAVVRIPGTRVVSGHQKCALAPNGAPDCNSAADAMCKTRGLASGKSLDMTTAEVCPPEVYLAGRRTGPGCTTDTFVSRALCQ